MANISQSNIKPIYKLIGKNWKELPTTGSVTISDNFTEKSQTKDLNSRNVTELEELLQRQANILKNEKFLLKLNDKGEKLKRKYEEILAALESTRADQEKPLQKSHQDINSLEWNETSNEIENVPQHNLDEGNGSDEEEMGAIDPLRLHANHSQIPKRRKRKQPEDPGDIITGELEKLSIQDNSLKNQNELSSEGTNVSTKLLQKAEKAEMSQNSHHKFRSNKPLRYPPKQTTKERISSLWEESSATGPIVPTCNRPTQALPLSESFKLVQKIQHLEKEQFLDSAHLHLKGSKKISIGFPSNAHLNYRDVNINRHILDESEDEDDILTTTFS